MASNYKTRGAGIEAIDHGEPIFVGDSVQKPTRALWVGTGGNIEVLFPDGSSCLLINVKDGTLLPIAITSIESGTTASDILALR